MPVCVMTGWQLQCNLQAHQIIATWSDQPHAWIYAQQNSKSFWNWQANSQYWITKEHDLDYSCNHLLCVNTVIRTTGTKPNIAVLCMLIMHMFRHVVHFEETAKPFITFSAALLSIFVDICWKHWTGNLCVLPAAFSLSMLTCAYPDGWWFPELLVRKHSATLHALSSSLLISSMVMQRIYLVNQYFNFLLS